MNDTSAETLPALETDPPVIRHGFTVGPLHLLVPSGVAAELLDEINVSPIPFTPSWFKGVANHRGEAVPVFSLPKLFAAPSGLAVSKSQHWLLVLDKPPRMTAFLLDSYPQLLNSMQEIDLDTVTDIPALIKPHINRAYQANSQNWLDFQHDAWLLSLKTRFQHYLTLR